MNGDGIAVKRVNEQDIEVLKIASGCFGFQRQTCVAGRDFDPSGRVAQVSEVSSLTLRQTNNGRIDLVEPINITGAGIGGDGSDAQPDCANAHGSRRALRICQEREPSTTAFAVISSRQFSILGQLNSVDDPA